MKLYATVTSERATKGQGGNEPIKISLKDENGQSVCDMTYCENGLGYELIMDSHDELGMVFTGFPCGYCDERLEYLRRELRAERISYGELAELQGLAKYIDPSDVELLEAAGVCEHCGETGGRHSDDACKPSKEDTKETTKGEKKKGEEYGCIFSHEHGNGSRCEYHSL